MWPVLWLRLLHGDLNSTQTSSGTYNPLLKMMGKWSVPCTAPVSTWLFLLCFTFITTRSNWKWSMAAISGFELHSLYFPVFDKVRKHLCSLVGDEILQPFSHRQHTASLLLLSHYFYVSLTAKTHHTMYTEENHPHFLPIPSVRWKFHSNSFFTQTTTLWNWLPRRCFPNDYSLGYDKLHLSARPLIRRLAVSSECGTTS